MDALADIARELLRVGPGEFVASRGARSRELRADDRALATAVGRLSKPAPAAWVVDLLAERGLLDDAVALGPDLRAAQERADPSEIATLRKQRARVVDALARSGADLAADAGHPVGDAVLDRVRATIEAAMADPHAGAVVRSGLLVRPLETVGFEPVDRDGAIAVPDAVPDAWRGSAEPVPITAGRRAAGRSRRSRSETHESGMPAPEASASGDDAADRRVRQAELRAARAAEAEARDASRRADRELDAADAALDEATAARDDLDASVVRLERELDRARADLADARDAVTARAEDRDRAESRAASARKALDAARRARRGAD